MKGDFQDELDKSSIDQLHKAVLQLSANCFELKRLCVTVLVSASTLFATFSNKRPDLAIFLIGTFIIIFFWLLDSQSYYYQEKLRVRMKRLAEEMAERHHEPETSVDGVGMPLTNSREERTSSQRVWTSMFNYSMLFYIFLLIIMEIIAALYLLGVIKYIEPTGSS